MAHRSPGQGTACVHHRRYGEREDHTHEASTGHVQDKHKIAMLGLYSRCALGRSFWVVVYLVVGPYKIDYGTILGYDSLCKP